MPVCRGGALCQGPVELQALVPALAETARQCAAPASTQARQPLPERRCKQVLGYGQGQSSRLLALQLLWGMETGRTPGHMHDDHPGPDPEVVVGPVLQPGTVGVQGLRADPQLSLVSGLHGDDVQRPASVLALLQTANSHTSVRMGAGVEWSQVECMTIRHWAGAQHSFEPQALKQGVIHKLCACMGGEDRQGGNRPSPDSHRGRPLAGVLAVYNIVCNVHEVRSHVVLIAHKLLYLHNSDRLVCACLWSVAVTWCLWWALAVQNVRNTALTGLASVTTSCLPPPRHPAPSHLCAFSTVSVVPAGR